MDYQQIALEVFNNKLSYKDDDYTDDGLNLGNRIGINYGDYEDLYKDGDVSMGELIMHEFGHNLFGEECLNCGVDMNEMYDDPIDGLCICCAEEEGRCDKCESLGIMMYGDDLCNGCVDQDSEYDD